MIWVNRTYPMAFNTGAFNDIFGLQRVISLVVPFFYQLRIIE
jgi:hypothetical protein